MLRHGGAQAWVRTCCWCTGFVYRREVGNTLLCVETDEMHHRSYDKADEQARYHDLMMGWGGKLVFIRFNPDKASLGPPLEQRLERLQAEITRQIARDACTVFPEFSHRKRTLPSISLRRTFGAV